MKRVLTFLAIMLLPLSVMAMTPVSDQTLSDVTGQAGVNINADIAMNISIGTIAWGDEDGLAGTYAPWGTSANGGYVGVVGFDITNLRIKARETDSYGIGYTEIATDDGHGGSVTINPGGHYFAPAFLKPITIDVAQGPSRHGGHTFVRFGLGSLQITMNSLDFDVRLGADPAGWDDLTAGEGMLGRVSVGALAIYINPISYVDIWADATCGVNLELNVVIDEFQMAYVSWGDIDGQSNTGIGTQIWMAPDAQSAGYVGLADLTIGGPITVAGQMSIDVTTTAAGIYSHGIVGTDEGAARVTVVHIQFGAAGNTNPVYNAADLFKVQVAGPIEAVVKLDSVAALNSGGAGTLGDIYISGFGLDIYGGSWVDIWAH